nr:hypothetical protein [Pseudomonas akapageensis]
MSRKTPQKRIPLAITAILAINLSFFTGCTNKHSVGSSSASTVGSSCFAKAMPTAGEGSLAWGPNLQVVRTNSIENCKRYAGRSGGTPNTCKVVEARCKN